MSRTSPRKWHIEALRIVAALFVLFNHTGEEGFFLFAAQPATSPLCWAYLSLSILCKAAVPLFFMASGALLLTDKREEPPRVTLTRRAGRMAAVLLLTSLGYEIWHCRLWETPFSVLHFLEGLYQGSICTPLWYLYAYLGMLVCLPLLRRLAQGLRDAEFRYWIRCLLLFQGVVPVAAALLWPDGAPASGFSLGWAAMQAVCYPCLGYFAEHRVPREALSHKAMGKLAVGCLAGIGASAALTLLAARRSGICTEAQSQGFFTLFTPLYALTIYLGLRRLCSPRPGVGEVPSGRSKSCNVADNVLRKSCGTDPDGAPRTALEDVSPGRPKSCIAAGKVPWKNGEKGPDGVPRTVARSRWARLLCAAGEGTFFLYLSHVWIMNLPPLRALRSALCPVLGEIGATLAYLVAVFVVGDLAGWALRRVPGVRKLI